MFVFATVGGPRAQEYRCRGGIRITNIHWLEARPRRTAPPTTQTVCFYEELFVFDLFFTHTPNPPIVCFQCVMLSRSLCLRALLIFDCCFLGRLVVMLPARWRFFERGNGEHSGFMFVDFSASSECLLIFVELRKNGCIAIFLIYRPTPPGPLSHQRLYLHARPTPPPAHPRAPPTPCPYAGGLCQSIGRRRTDCVHNVILLGALIVGFHSTHV